MNIATESSIRLVTEVPGPRSVELQKLRETLLPRGVGSVLPVFVQRASGATLEDVDGNRFLDFTGGIGCQNAGHVVPEVVAAVQNQAEQFLHTCFMVTPYRGISQTCGTDECTGSRQLCQEDIFCKQRRGSGGERRKDRPQLYQVTGGDRLRRRVPRPHPTGDERLPESRIRTKAASGPFAPEIYRMPYAYCYRCPYNLKHPECNVECAQQLEMTFRRQVEAMMRWPRSSSNPYWARAGLSLHPGLVPVIVEICRKNGILVIADEIQTGLCWTGPLFACERF